jgi:hypothetical protein
MIGAPLCQSSTESDGWIIPKGEFDGVTSCLNVHPTGGEYLFDLPGDVTSGPKVGVLPSGFTQQPD